VAIEVRTIEEGEAGDWVEALSTGFLRHAAVGEAEQRRQGMYLDRTWAAFDGTRVVGTLRSFPTPLTVPGPAEVTASGLTNVTVLPTHRRRGALTQMITRDLTDSAERGEALSILIAAEYPIYGRYGYGAAVESATYAIDAAQAAFRTPSEGTIELVDAVTLRKEGPSIYDDVRTVQPGYIGRNDRWWDLKLRLIEVPGEEERKAWQVIYRSPAGRAEGYVWYKVKEQWGDDMRANGLLTVEDLVAATPAAYHALWEFCINVDWVTRIETPDRSVDETLSWLVADGRVMYQKSRFDFVWARLLDVSAALGARAYAAPGSVIIDVVDPLGLTAGRYLLEAGRDGAQCTPCDRAAVDVTLPVSTLGSIYLGGYSLRTLAAAGLVDEHRPGAVATLDAMFRSPVTPWCSTWF
jgi:predicted acetyltransferase